MRMEKSVEVQVLSCPQNQTRHNRSSAILSLVSMDEQKETKKLLEETLALSRENNKLLRTIRRVGMIEFVMRLLWYAILIGFPFAVYFYIVEPYFHMLGLSSGHSSQDVQSLPVIKALGIIFGRQ